MKIAIRKFENNDVLKFYEAVAESVGHLSFWFPWCKDTYSVSEAEFWVKSSKEAWESGVEYRFVIENLESGEIIGSVGINQIVKAHKIGNLGYWTRKSYLNRGVCQKAASLAIEYAFRELGFQRIEIHVLVENYASIRVAERIGAIYEGEQRNKLFFKNCPCTAKCYSVIPADIAF